MLDENDKLSVEENELNPEHSSKPTKIEETDSPAVDEAPVVAKNETVEEVEAAEKSETVEEVEAAETSETVEEVEAAEKCVTVEEAEVAEKSDAVQEIPVVQSNKAVDEIENRIAESSEKEEHNEIELIDYNKLSLEELVEELKKLVKEQPVQSIYNNVNKIKSAFNLKFGALLKKEKDAFLAEGGNVIDFQYSNPIKSTYNSILYDYKIKRNEFYKNQENQLKDNLDLKLELIEELKHLIDNAHGASMYKMFKMIQTRWREIGPIPRAKYNDTWRTYHHHVERFYDLLHLSNDLRDLDFKHNLEEKLKLVEKAEELAEMEDVNLAFKELQVLHKMWKEDIGPVAQENREEVWERFSEATKKVHDKRHEFFKVLKSKYEENIEKKIAVIDEIAAYDISKNHTRADWQKSIQDIEMLRNKFFAVGKVPRAKSDEIWAKFKEATRKFNSEKNKFFKGIKKDHLDNLNKKKALIEKAESLKDSEDWDAVTDIMKQIQQDWKKIGHVPRKYSDKLWKDFKDACNHYFDRLHAKQDEGNKEQLEIFNKKKELFAELKLKVDANTEFSLDDVKKYVDDWRQLGRVPYEMRHIDVKFNKLLDKIVAMSPIDKKDVEMLKFQNLVNSYLNQKNYRKLDSEQLFVRKKIDEIIREIQQLENNIGFISNVSDDNPLVKNVRDQINAYNDKLEIWRSKLNYLKQLEY